MMVVGFVDTFTSMKSSAKGARAKAQSKRIGANTWVATFSAQHGRAR
jgi:hypothetical protein